MLHAQRLIGIDRGKVAELGAIADLLGIHAVNGRDLGEAGALVAAARGSQRALDHITRTQACRADEICGDKGVVAGLHIAVGMDDAGAVRANLQNALYVAETLGLRSGGVDFLDELGLLLAGRLDLELLGLFAQLGDLHSREFLARKRRLGRGGVALLVALLAIALTVTAVVVAFVFALVALVVTLVLTAVGAGVLIGLGGRGALGRRSCGVGVGRDFIIGLGIGIGIGLGIDLLLGGLSLCRLLARTLGLLGCRLTGVLGIGSGVDGRPGDLVARILGRVLFRTLGLGRALSGRATAATGANIGGLALGGCVGLGGSGSLGRSVGDGRGRGGHRGVLRCGCCSGSGSLLGLDEGLGLAAATVRTKSRIDNGNLVGLGRCCRLRGLRTLPYRRTSRSFTGLLSRLLSIQLRLGRTTTRARSRLLGRLPRDRGLGGRIRLEYGRSHQLGQSCGLKLGSTATGAHNLSLADLCQRAGLCNLIGNGGRGIGGNGSLRARDTRRATLGLCSLLAVSGGLRRTACALGLYGRGILFGRRGNSLASSRRDLLSRCGRRRRSGPGGIRNRCLRRCRHRDLVRRNRCSGSGLRRRYFVFLLLIRHSVCSTFFSSPVITCSLHIPSGRLNSLAPSNERRASLICIEMIASYTQR